HRILVRRQIIGQTLANQRMQLAFHREGGRLIASYILLQLALLHRNPSSLFVQASNSLTDELFQYSKAQLFLSNRTRLAAERRLFRLSRIFGADLARRETTFPSLSHLWRRSRTLRDDFFALTHLWRRPCTLRDD